MAVLADMKELGENTPEYHRQVGEYAGKAGISLIVALGEASRELTAAARAVSDVKTVEFEDRGQMESYLEEELKEGDCVLFKGSNSMGLSVTAEKFLREAGTETE